MDRLDLAVAAVTPYLLDPSVSAAVLVNPLLLVWDAAQAVHPDVAGPVEELLTTLLHRTITPSVDVRRTIEEIRARALQELVLRGGVLTG